MYNRLTLVDELTHKDAVEKIIADHQHFTGFSARNIRRYLPLDSPAVPKRIRPSWPKNNTAEANNQSQLSNTEQENNTDTESAYQNNSITGFSNDSQKRILDFEFSLPWEDVHRYMGLKFKVDGSFASVWFNGRIEMQTGKVIFASVGNISEHHHDDN